MLKYVETKNAPAAIGPYSQGIILNGIAFFSGQIPLSPETGEVVGTTIEEQTEQVMKKIEKGKTIPEIADALEEDEETIRRIVETLSQKHFT